MGPSGAAGRDGDPGVQGEKGDRGQEGLQGPAGIAGRDGLPGVQGPQGEKGLDGRHGTDGLNGKDGLGFDDLNVEYDGERTFTLKFSRGDETKAFPFTVPFVLDRGVYTDTKAYTTGDAVSWGGSMWIAKAPTSGIKPDEATSMGKMAWRLAVKRGREGKAGMKGERGDQGLRGEKGDRGPDRY